MSQSNTYTHSARAQCTECDWSWAPSKPYKNVASEVAAAKRAAHRHCNETGHVVDVYIVRVCKVMPSGR